MILSVSLEKGSILGFLQVVTTAIALGQRTLKYEPESLPQSFVSEVTLSSKESISDDDSGASSSLDDVMSPEDLLVPRKADVWSKKRKTQVFHLFLLFFPFST